ncbi:MAG: 1-aminocyclopropane-1-carboxylate deaminase/D-cysteine desulfhydrase [Candidatus Thorarchaeota archaeon]
MTATPLLYDKYPELQDKIPRVQLGNFPTPVQEMKNLENRLGHSNLWIKRDDLSGELYGGNKLRKLEYILADALQKKKKWILTFGGLGSNHAIATAIYGREQGFKSVLVFIDQPITEHVQRQLLRFQQLDAKVSYAKNVYGAYLKGLWHLASKRGTFLLRMGGSIDIGNIGYVEAALELVNQIETGILPKPERIYLPVGTMGTFAGLTVGLKLADSDIDLIGVRVSESSICNERNTAQMINSTFKFLRKQSKEIPQIKVKPEEVNINHEFAGPCYGSVTKEGLDAIELMKTTENIQLETSYTGKALACMVKHINDGNISDGSTLFWNTYNSADLSSIDNQINYEDYKQLPKSFHQFFQDNLISH